VVVTERVSITRCLAILGSAVAVAAIFFAGILLGITLFFSEADKSVQLPSSGETPFKIAAIGDGYMSGEGATAFFPGTDKPGRNQCRRTATSYPFLVAATLEPPAGHDGVELVSVACSGARTTHVIAFDDLECRDEWFPDGCPNPQYQYIANGMVDPTYQVDAVPSDAELVLVSVGAGDAQLNEVIATCAERAGSCRSSVEPWLDALDVSLQWRLRRVYAAAALRAPRADIVAMTYPIPFYRESCSSTRLDQDETDLMVQDFIPRLNEQIALAAAAEGISVVDLTDALAGHRLCQPDRPDGRRSEVAMEAFQVRPVRAFTWNLSTWFHGSFYPNEYGHELIADALGDELDQLLGRSRASSRPRGSGEVTPAFAVGPPGESLVETDSECGSRRMESRFIARPITAGR
jgi:hypothetical protein